MTRRHRTLALSTLLLTGLLAGCKYLPVPVPPVSPPRSAAPKTPPSRLDCSFTDDTGSHAHSYRMTAGAIVELGPPHTRFKITSDDGETVTARHEARGGASALLTIDLRQHEAVLTQVSSVTGEQKTQPGTCAEVGGAN
ncbi:hypothetical protein GCM10011611_35430 [Aliidongia dinghuensis]|uniref:Uncharacterized protein n=1 Tax=Aliidongia dinghuensis TaxID=1867774 RepID=A0A8J2YVA7_9PROT|nr:hypothetical protein [Aliidongia dinghuensis]GGF26286.1 hypothetical protein GCM10011611_35430 [Aliidongia dinghuensis]